MIKIKTCEINIKEWNFVPYNVDNIYYCDIPEKMIYLSHNKESKIRGYLFEPYDKTDEYDRTGSSSTEPLIENLYILCDDDTITHYSITYNDVVRYFGFNEKIIQISGPPSVENLGLVTDEKINDDKIIDITRHINGTFSDRKIVNPNVKCTIHDKRIVCSIILECAYTGYGLFDKCIKYYDEKWNHIKNDNTADD